MNARTFGLRWTFWLWVTAGVLLLLPLLAMQVTDAVAWDAFDFLAAAALFGIVAAASISRRVRGGARSAPGRRRPPFSGAS